MYLYSFRIYPLRSVGFVNFVCLVFIWFILGAECKAEDGKSVSPKEQFNIFYEPLTKTVNFTLLPSISPDNEDLSTGIWCQDKIMEGISYHHKKYITEFIPGNSHFIDVYWASMNENIIDIRLECKDDFLLNLSWRFPKEDSHADVQEWLSRESQKWRDTEKSNMYLQDYKTKERVTMPFPVSPGEHRYELVINPTSPKFQIPSILFFWDIDSPGREAFAGYADIGFLEPRPRTISGYREKIDDKVYNGNCVYANTDSGTENHLVISLCAARMDEHTLDILCKCEESFLLNLQSSRELRKISILDASQCYGPYVQRSSRHDILRDYETKKEMAIPALLGPGEYHLEVVKKNEDHQNEEIKKPLPPRQTAEMGLAPVIRLELDVDERPGSTPISSSNVLDSPRFKIYNDAITVEWKRVQLEDKTCYLSRSFTHPESEWGFHILSTCIVVNTNDGLDIHCECIEPIVLDLFSSVNITNSLAKKLREDVAAGKEDAQFMLDTLEKNRKQENLGDDAADKEIVLYLLRDQAKKEKLKIPALLTPGEYHLEVKKEK